MLVNKVKDAGVVGAGGAGFPTHIKIDAKVDTVIINGAECEPLLYKDKELLRLKADEVIQGLKSVMEQMKANKGIIAFKDKKANEEAKKIYHDKTKSVNNMEVFLLGDYYPSGDEVLLVYDVTGKVVPPGGIPLSVGVVNSNVETFINIYNASRGQPVTEKFITICGAVVAPFTCVVPIGTRIGDIIEKEANVLTDSPALMTGGVMMGRYVEAGMDDVITKTCGGYVVLPDDHYLVKRKTAPKKQYNRTGKSACDQCSYCTEFCPRYLVGHPIEPHRVMRSLEMSGSGYEVETEYAAACIECGLCGLMACPEELSPHSISGNAKREILSKGFKFDPNRTYRAHPMYHHRKTPINRLIQKLGLSEYDRPAHLEEINFIPEKVTIPLKQHIGIPSEPVVEKGSLVQRGELIAKIPDGKLGSNIHASISGKIIEVSAENITIENK